MLRDLQSNLMGNLVVVPGIVTAASKTAIKATTEILRCTNCGHEKKISIKLGYGGARHPRVCEAVGESGQERPKCPLDPYRVVTEKCVFVDQQTLKL
jgi:DNA replication licensing factor MCM5